MEVTAAETRLPTTCSTCSDACSSGTTPSSNTHRPKSRRHHRKQYDRGLAQRSAAALCSMHWSPIQDSVTSSDDTARAMNAVRSIVRALRLNTRSIEGKLGISLAQLFVLQQLVDKPVESLNELAERTATHQSSVSVVVRRLVDRGFVTRVASSADRRRVQIALTPDGEAILRGAPPTVQSDLIHGMSRMQPEQ